jgi:hypothetical protein
MREKPKSKNYKLYALIALAVVALSAMLITFQGANLQGRLALKPAATSVRDLKPLSGEPGPYSGEAVPDAINKAELAKLVAATLNVDTASYKGCAPDVLNQWYEGYACYMVSRKAMSLASDGLFHGEQTMTRAEGAKVFTKAFVKEVNWYSGSQVVFKDVPVTQWYYVYVMTLAQNKVLDVEPILAGQILPLEKASKKGYFLPQNLLGRKAATTWAQKVAANLL